jgi:hypothetical protein
MSPGQHPRPADLGKAGCSWPPAPAATADHPAQKGHQPEPLNHVHYQRAPRPAARHDPHPARRPGGYQGTGTRLSHAPDQGNHDRIGPRADRPPRNLTREPSREPSSGSTGRSQACPIGGKPTGPRPLSNSCTPTGPRRPPHARFPETVTEHACGHRRMQVRRISRDGCGERTSRSATRVPEHEGPYRLIGTFMNRVMAFRAVHRSPCYALRVLLMPAPSEPTRQASGGQAVHGSAR